MTSCPWLPLYCADCLADTQHLTAEQCGAYMRLLMLMWLAPEGRLPLDDKKLARCASVTLFSWRKRIAPEIMPLLTVEESTVTQKRLQKERIRCEQISLKRSAAAEAKHLKNKNRPSASAYTSYNHSYSNRDSYHRRGSRFWAAGDDDEKEQ